MKINLRIDVIVPSSEQGDLQVEALRDPDNSIRFIEPLYAKHAGSIIRETESTKTENGFHVPRYAKINEKNHPIIECLPRPRVLLMRSEVPDDLDASTVLNPERKKFKFKGQIFEAGFSVEYTGLSIYDKAMNSVDPGWVSADQTFVRRDIVGALCLVAVGIDVDGFEWV